MPGRTRVFLHGAIAAIVALGMCGQHQLKAQDATGPVGGGIRVGPAGVVPDDSPNAGPAMYQGIVLAGANPAQGNPTPTWPCPGGGGDPQCSSIAAGGFVIPLPVQVISANDNGEVVWTFTSLTASGTADCKVTVTHG